MKLNKKTLVLVSVLFGVVVLALTSSYALFSLNVTKNSNFKLVVGTLELSITDTVTEDKYILENTVPTKDEVALAGDGYNFTVTNTGTIDSYYTVYLDDILLNDAGERLSNSYVKLNFVNNTTNVSTTKMMSELEGRVLDTGFLNVGESVSYTLRMWVDYNVGNEAQNKYFATQIRIDSTQSNAVEYKEALLNGADPVLTDNLVPVIIADDGTVTKAATNSQWYDYETKQWANAVVLKDASVKYANNETIPESNIESYFVWIPRYKYKIFNLGNYTNLTSLSSSTQVIDVVFEDKDTEVSSGTTVSSYLTHPAFLAFDTNGFWVGKFETGYDGATSTTTAQANNGDSSKIIIKPNVYSWTNVTIGNIFKVSYDYLRDDESHMMKNTEWGAVAYLQHSTYGSQVSLRVNNNSAYITGYAAKQEPTVLQSNSSVSGNRYESTSLGVDGTYTVNYLNINSNVASTTGNKTGVYDMSGGAWEYVAGYTTGATTVGGSSGITSIYSDFFTNSIWNKYYDKYTSTASTDYNYRILGDATGEVGSFGSGSAYNGTNWNISSWYNDIAYFAGSSIPWFFRGGGYNFGTGSGIFSFYPSNGSVSTGVGFRIVLAPTK